jgi:23S rRNA pseudouridine1911/1915/1917 synthase
MSEETSAVVRLVAGDAEWHRRVDSWVASAFSVSRSRAVSLLASGAIRLNGAQVEPDHHVKVGDVLEGEAGAVVEISAKGEKGTKIPVVHEDAHLIVVDKPAGLTVHPGAGRPGGTLVNVLLGMGKKLAPAGGRQRPGVVHRLDKDTSGLMVLARTDEAFWKLAKMVEAHEIHREYLAVVAGVPSPLKGTISAQIDRDRRNREKYAVVPAGGREAITHYEVVEKFAGASLVRVILETGRTHQIRVHFSAMGWPLAGDETYGNRLPKGTIPAFRAMTRQALHSARISFDHPVTGKPMLFKSVPPADFQALVKALREGAPEKPRAGATSTSKKKVRVRKVVKKRV